MGMGSGGSSGSTLWEGQKSVGRDLQNFLLGREERRQELSPDSLIGQAATPFLGQRVAELPPEALRAREALGAFDPSAFQANTAVALNRALSGVPTSQVDPAATEGFFRDAVADPAMRHFDREIRPRLRAGLASSGMLSSTSNLNQTREALSSLQAGLSSQLAGMQLENQRFNIGLQEAAAARSLQAVPMANAQATEPIRRASSLLAAAAPFAAQDQAQLDANFQEFMRTSPEASPWTSQAMQFFGSQGPTAMEAPSGNLGMAGAGVGALAGALLAIPTGGASIPFAASALPGLGAAATSAAISPALGAALGAGVGGAAGSFIRR